MKSFTLVFNLAIILCSHSFSQISLTGVGTYTQDFNTLANSGTSSTVPLGWFLSESGTNANTTYSGGTGSGNTGDTYSFGAASSSERAFGGLLSGSLNPTIGANFTNNTGFIITQIPITYIGEQWRLGALNRFDRIDFQYSLNATSLTNGTWMDVNELDFTTPDTSGAVGQRDGNSTLHKTSISFIVTGLNIMNGSSFWLRWIDFNALGADDGLAIDDFSINETVLPVELSSFSAIILENSVKLHWRTETEVNNYGFEVQKSENGSQELEWNTIGFVEGNGNSNSPKDYSFTDNVMTGRYAYRLKQIDTDGKFDYSKSIEIDLGSPAKFELSQNFPNPFNPVTTIRFILPGSGNVSLKVYNLLGELIAEPVNEFKEAGIHTINFNASQLNSGIYIYKMEANGFVESRKMSLIK